jgi:ribose transport system substrate-binding protein
MVRSRRHVLSVAAVLGVVIAGSGVSAASSVRSSAAQGGAPYVVHRSWGTFHLGPKIAAKLKSHKPINYVFSYEASGIPLFSPQYLDGFKAGCAAGQKIYPMTCTPLAPVQDDINQQISQVLTKLSAGAIDCLSIETTTSNGSTTLSKQLMDKGIPVFTVGVTSHGHEFTNFTQNPLKEGVTAARTVIAYMKIHHLHFKYFAVSSGNPSQYWAQGRMTSFMRYIKANVPGAVFLNSPSSPVNTTFDPASIYDRSKAFILGHKQLQVFENSDIGADQMDRAIVDTGKKGKLFTVGWNVSKANLDYIDKGVQIGTMDQKWAEQAAFGGKACAEFLAHGKILPNTQRLLAVTQAQVCPLVRRQHELCTNVATARKQLNKVLSGH